MELAPDVGFAPVAGSQNAFQNSEGVPSSTYDP